MIGCGSGVRYGDKIREQYGEDGDVSSYFLVFMLTLLDGFVYLFSLVVTSIQVVKRIKSCREITNDEDFSRSVFFVC